jgi:hypothetical protein
MAAIRTLRRQQRDRALLGALAIATTLVWWSSATGQSSASYEVPRQSMDGGAGRSSSASYELHATVGQLDAGAPMSSASFSLRGGFHRAAPAEALPDLIFANGFEAP